MWPNLAESLQHILNFSKYQICQIVALSIFEFLSRSDTIVCISYRIRKILQNDCLLANIGIGKSENERAKIWPACMPTLWVAWSLRLFSRDSFGSNPREKKRRAMIFTTRLYKFRDMNLTNFHVWSAILVSRRRLSDHSNVVMDFTC